MKTQTQTPAENNETTTVQDGSATTEATTTAAPVKEKKVRPTRVIHSSPLKTVLQTKTVKLLEKYKERAKAWATRRFESAQAQKDWTDEQWKEKYPLVIKGENGEPDKVDTTKLSRGGKWRKEEVTTVNNKGLEKLLQEAEKLAEVGYDEALNKVVGGFANKGVLSTTTEVEVIEATVDRNSNIDITIKVGEVSIHAWTIVASGPVISAHFRFLVY